MRLSECVHKNRLFGCQFIFSGHIRCPMANEIIFNLSVSSAPNFMHALFASLLWWCAWVSFTVAAANQIFYGLRNSSHHILYATSKYRWPGGAMYRSEHTAATNMHSELLNSQRSTYKRRETLVQNHAININQRLYGHSRQCVHVLCDASDGWCGWAMHDV